MALEKHISNRITRMVIKFETLIATKLASGEVTQAKLDKLNKVNDLELLEYCQFQELKSLAFAQGKLSAEEAQTVYGYLGNSVETFNGQSVSVKCALTQLLHELIEWRLGMWKSN